jgi:hypothetical protein
MLADDDVAGGAAREGQGVKASQDTRQRTIDALCEHFAADTLDLDEFERRVDLAHKAETVEALRDLLRDLPAPGTAVVAADQEATATPAPTVRSHVARADLVRDNQIVLGFWGGPSRKGDWIPARHVWSVAVMGGVQLDFREARMGPGVTEVSVLALWGGVEIIVPPDLQVEFNGIGIMGGFECSEEVRRVYDPDAPILKINGLAIMGGAEVTVREPGETARDAKRRRRLERKERRRLRRG